MKQFDRRLRSAENREKESRKKFFIPLIFLAVVLVVVFVFFLGRGKRKVYNAYDTIQTAQLSTDSTIHYLSLDGGYLSYGRDGAAAFNAQGEQRWNIAYTMKNPVAAICGTYTAIADRGDKQFILN